eukprot:TRINITY_DN3539_c0_g1_i10.p2 TRINITY_DN3539_c0_g1~~TRINITY_DN3539_c0_g1_i10.p2  ORF type:complete len:190 (-),score=-25.63 TRINITY_DN3539_c0_g1_i10:448-1017(-)
MPFLRNKILNLYSVNGNHIIQITQLMCAHQKIHFLQRCQMQNRQFFRNNKQCIFILNIKMKLLVVVIFLLQQTQNNYQKKYVNNINQICCNGIFLYLISIQLSYSLFQTITIIICLSIFNQYLVIMFVVLNYSYYYLSQLESSVIYLQQYYYFKQNVDLRCFYFICVPGMCDLYKNIIQQMMLKIESFQ